MAKFTWLHLTDLHCGMKEQEHLWPNIRDKFFDDLKKMHDRTGQWDAVLFTGDLVQRGAADEFDKLNKLLDKLWEHFEKLGSNPILLAVPGNHDLVRPDPKSSAMRLLTKWQLNPEIHEEFWEDPKSEYRKIIEEAFANYSAWWEEKTCNLSLPIQSGILPGDFSLSLEQEGLKIGIVGLNATFLQLGAGDYFERLAIDTRQLHKACNTNEQDSAEWIKHHHLCLFMTHQPPKWLDKSSRANQYPEIAPAGRFAAHLFGHMHEHISHDESFGGGSIQRFRQGCSLFGLEQYGEENNQVARQHGYAVHQIEINNGSGQMRIWPRLAKKHKVNGWHIVADTKNFSGLEEDEGTRSLSIEVLSPIIPANDSSVLTLSAKPTKKVATNSVRSNHQLFNGWAWPHEEPELKEYCEALAKAHGYIRFVEVPFLKDTSDVEIESLYVDPQFSKQEIHADTSPKNWPTRTDAVKAIQKYRHLVLLGDPGSGKSTLTSCITWQLCRCKIDRHNHWTEVLGGLVPIPMVLRELKLKADISWERLLDAFLEHRIGKLLGTRKRLEQLLESGRAIILLDGLDELGDLITRRKLRDAVQAGLSAYPEARWILTSRIVGYDQVPFHIDEKLTEPDPLLPFSDLHEIKYLQTKTRGQSPLKHSARNLFEIRFLSPFSDEQITKFSQNWYKQHEPEPSLIKEKSTNLVGAIHDNEGTQRLARIPFLLTLMALTHHSGGRLPHGRAELYDRIAAAYLDRIDARRGLNQLPYSLEQKKLWLSEIAYQMQKRRITKRRAESRGLRNPQIEQQEILANQKDVRVWLSKAIKQSGAEDVNNEAKSVLDYFASRSGLLLPRGEGQFAFMHLSLQEYFAACFLEQHLATPRFSAKTQTGPSDADLRTWANESPWRETFVLLFEKLAGKPEYSEALLKHLFDSRNEIESTESQATAMQLLAEVLIDPYISLTAETRKQMRRQCWLWAISLKNSSIELFDYDFLSRGIERTLLSEHSGDVSTAWKAAGLSSSDLENRAYRLDLSGCVTINDLKPLAKLISLNSLHLDGCSQLTTLRQLGNFKNLRTLTISGCSKIKELTPLRRFTELQILNIQGCKSITDISSIAKLKGLRNLALNRCANKKYLQPLVELQDLETLIIDGADGPVDLTPLSKLYKLRDLHLHDFQGKTDLSPLVGLVSNLRNLCAARSDNLIIPPEFDELTSRGKRNRKRG